MDEKTLQQFLCCVNFPRKTPPANAKELSNLAPCPDGCRGQGCDQLPVGHPNMQGGHLVIGVEDRHAAHCGYFFFFFFQGRGGELFQKKKKKIKKNNKKKTQDGSITCGNACWSVAGRRCGVRQGLSASTSSLRTTPCKRVFHYCPKHRLRSPMTSCAAFGLIRW